MSSPSAQPPGDPREQLLRYLDGSLPSDEVAGLNATLKSDAALRRDLAELLLQQIQLAELGHAAQASASATLTLAPLPAAEQPSSPQNLSENVGQASSLPVHGASPPRGSNARMPPELADKMSAPHFQTGSQRMTGWRRHALPLLALAACLALLLGVSIWFFGPTMGEPGVAELRGNDVSVERGTEMIPASRGMRLQPTDVLRTGTNATATINFGSEKTRLELRPGSELKLVSLARGKRLDLREGKIEATVARQRLFKPMLVRTPQAEARVLGTEFTLAAATNATRLEVSEGKVKLTRSSDNASVNVGAGHYTVAATNYVLAEQPLPGKVLREFWLDLAGGTLQDLIYHLRYPNAPSGHDFPPSFETNTNWPSAFGTRTRGFLLPPVTGDYEFRISGNGQVCLWLSPDDDPAEQFKVGQIVFTRNRPGDPGLETLHALQESGPVPLEAGRRYYIEVAHKYGTGEDRLSVIWKRPDGTEEPIPAEFLSPFIPKKNGAKR